MMLKMNKYKKDYNLVLELNALKTGANVHRIETLLQYYYNSIALYNSMNRDYSGYSLTKFAREIGKLKKDIKKQHKAIKTIEKEIKQYIILYKK